VTVEVKKGDKNPKFTQQIYLANQLKLNQVCSSNHIIFYVKNFWIFSLRPSLVIFWTLQMVPLKLFQITLEQQLVLSTPWLRVQLYYDIIKICDIDKFKYIDSKGAFEIKDKSNPIIQLSPKFNFDLLGKEGTANLILVCCIY